MPPDCHNLLAAQGFAELGNDIEATAKIEMISPQSRLHPEVLEIRCHIFSKAKKWHACVDVASQLVRLAPKQACSWLQRAFALHELKRTQEAFDNLLPVAEKFPDFWTIPYNLACYCSQLDRFDEAQHLFKTALVIGGVMVQNASIADPDLKPLWTSMSTRI